jgi:hypothetical protein
VEFYSSSVSKELKGEEEMGRRIFSGGIEGDMMALRFGSSRMERCRWKPKVGADGSRRWEPMERRKRAERRNGLKAEEPAA